MSKPFLFPLRRWMMIPALALGFLVWINVVQVQRIHSTTSLFEETPKHDAASSTGYANGTRELIVPERNPASYHLIAQTQQMFARNEGRVRRVDYDNAPFGRPVNSASPPRWWLGLIAYLDYAFTTERSLGAAVEKAALYADPLLHVLLLIGTTVFVARKFGVWPAALISVGLATLFPLATSFTPGAPDEEGLAQICALWSVLFLLAATAQPPPPVLKAVGPSVAIDRTDLERRARRGFIAAGIAAGFGLWISVTTLVPVLCGIGLGALAAAWLTRRAEASRLAGLSRAPLWRAWAISGAATVLVTYFLEFFPAYLGSWELQVTHPLYGLAWLGAGELLTRAVIAIQEHKPRWGVRDVCVIIVSLAAVAAVPMVMIKTHDQGFLAVSTSSLRLTKLSGTPLETSLKAWLGHDGGSLPLLLTLSPILLVVGAVWQVIRFRGQPTMQATLALSLGPVLVALGLACWRMNEWALFDGLVLVTLTALTASLGEASRLRAVGWTLNGFIALILLLGAGQLLTAVRTDIKTALSEAELMGLIDRDLGHWLAKHASSGGSVVLAPPKATTALFYYGGLRGLGTLAWENQEGITAAVRLVSASTMEEAKELIDRRSIKYIIIPSWDSYLDQYARMGTGQLDGTFLLGLHTWKLPPWLRPVSYQLPTIAGFEGQSVQILEVVEDQDDAVALGRLAEYFIEMGQVEQATSVAQALRRFPSDLGALVARAQVEIVRNDLAAFGRTLELIRPRLASATDRGLPWDRRASLAVVLARAKLNELSRAQVQRCVTEIDETNLRSLTTGALYRLDVLAKAFGLQINDLRLRSLALDLLPPDLRTHLLR